MAQLQARFVKIIDTKEGTSKSGDPYKFMTILVTTDGHYPKNVVLQCGTKAIPYVEKLTTGQLATFDYDIESREYNGKWYTSANVFKVSAEDAAYHNVKRSTYSEDELKDDLPF